MAIRILIADDHTVFRQALREFIEKEFVKAAVKSPKEISQIHIDTNEIKKRLFICNLSEPELKKFEFAQGYINKGEKNNFCRKRPHF